jgi:hypothetical protein
VQKKPLIFGTQFRAAVGWIRRCGFKVTGNDSKYDKAKADTNVFGRKPSHRGDDQYGRKSSCYTTTHSPCDRRPVIDKGDVISISQR